MASKLMLVCFYPREGGEKVLLGKKGKKISSLCMDRKYQVCPNKEERKKSVEDYRPNGRS